MRREWLILLIVAGSAWGAEPLIGTAAPDPQTPAVPTASSLPRQLLQLGDPDYYVREQAIAAITAAGSDAIDPLIQTATKGSAEVAARAAHALENLFLSKDPDVADRADDALEQLADSDNPRTAMRAEAILSRHQQLREQRAVEAIRALGGKVQYDFDGASLSMAPGFGFPMQRQDELEPTMVPLRLNTILIGTDWTGGVEGLKHLRRLRHRSAFSLYVIRGSGVPFEVADGLSRDLRELVVLDRGPFLGIGGSQQPPCRVESLTPGAAADRAQLKVSDRIVSVNGTEVSLFEELVGLLKDHRPGETVTVRVERFAPELRAYREFDLPVTLDRWEPYFSQSADLLEPEDAPPIPLLQLR